MARQQGIWRRLWSDHPEASVRSLRIQSAPWSAVALGWAVALIVVLIRDEPASTVQVALYVLAMAVAAFNAGLRMNAARLRHLDPRQGHADLAHQTQGVEP